MQSLHAVPDANDSPPTGQCDHEAELLEARQRIADFEGELAIARTIAMAVGVLMATFRLSSDAAFDMLIVATENTQSSLYDIAKEVVETGTLNWNRDIAPRPHGLAAAQ